MRCETREGGWTSPVIIDEGSQVRFGLCPECGQAHAPEPARETLAPDVHERDTLPAPPEEAALLGSERALAHEGAMRELAEVDELLRGLRPLGPLEPWS